MKQLASMTVVTLACLAAHGQGTIFFSTYNYAPASNVVTGQPIPAGNEWSAQLYYGPAGAFESQLASCTNAPAHFATAGYIVESIPYYTDPAAVSGGAFATVQVRIWSSVLGNSWESAYANWLSGAFGVWTVGVAKSNLGLIRTGNPNSVPPGLPASLRGSNPGEIGIRPFSFVPIPEPALGSLAICGALVLLGSLRRVN